VNPVVLSGTANLVPSGTRSSCYRGLDSTRFRFESASCDPCNLPNQNSHGILLTDICKSRTANNPRADRKHTAATSVPQPSDCLTHVELTWVEKKIEFWLRFGRPVAEQILDRRRRVVSFRPQQVFALVRWASNGFGTVLSRLNIVRAVDVGESYQTLPFVRPGGDILLKVEGWPKVERVLQAIDAIEALGIAATEVPFDHWRHIHNRIAAGIPFRDYTTAHHRAVTLRRSARP
jgi:hypothetical protein